MYCLQMFTETTSAANTRHAQSCVLAEVLAEANRRVMWAAAVRVPSCTVGSFAASRVQKVYCHMQVAQARLQSCARIHVCTPLLEGCQAVLC